MAIIYKYPSDEITLNDYLIGTDQSEENVTRSFKVSEVVNTILASLNNSTVTSVTGADSKFISFTGGPITTSGTLTASLSATGTPSSLTYLRGDGTWALPGPTPTDITTITSGNTLTTDTESWNFTGTGVTANVSSNDQVTVDIPGVGTFVDSVLDGIGITTTGDTTTNPSTGNVTITNNLYQLRAGGNTTLSSTTGNITISTVKNAGTVISVNSSIGTEVTDATTNAKLEIDLTGSNNYIRTVNEEGGQDVFATITEDDLLPYNQLTSSNVKTSRAGNITQDMLSAIKTYIDNADKNKVANVEPSGYTTTAKAMQMVTLTITEYNQIVTKDPNTIYLIVGAGTAHTVTLNRILNITDTGTGGTASPSNYNVSTTINSNPGTSITGVNGTPYNFATSFTALNGYSISSGPTFSPTTPITGTISGSATLNQTITASITPPISSCTMSVQVVNVISGNAAGTATITPPSPLTDTTSCGGTSTFNASASFNASVASGSVGWSTSPTGPFVTPASLSFTNNGQSNEPIYVGGSLNYINYSVDLVVTNNVTVTGSGAGTPTYTLGFTGNSSQSSSISQAGGTISAALSGLTQGASYSFTLNSNQPSINEANYAWTTPITATFTPSSGTISGANATVNVTLTGQITYTQPPQLQYRKLDATAVMNAAISGSQYSLVSAVQTPSPASSGTYTYTTPSFQASGGYFFNPSAPTVSMSPIGSNGTVTFNVTGGQSGSGTSSGDPLIENNPTITGSATMTPITVTIKVTYTLNSNATYSVQFNGATSPPPFTVYGSGSQQTTSFAVTSSNTVSFSLSRTGSSWCDSTNTCVGGQLYTPTCGAQYQCPASVPEGSGSWQAKLNGTGVNPYLETWTAGSTNLSYRSGQFAAMNNNDTCEIVIIEN
mgnify:FL=1|tara:strand:+ start:15960 stop:18638 length:2679 start_codon:yes stop_codon:yes gene_type:complete